MIGWFNDIYSRRVTIFMVNVIMKVKMSILNILFDFIFTKYAYSV